MTGPTLAAVLAAHAPLRHAETGRITWCSCSERRPSRESLRFDRDADGNSRKDGADERAWAEHVEQALVEAYPLAETCDQTMPHRVDMPAPEGCPPNCPTRVAEQERHDALAAEERLDLARRALVATGYFTADEVGRDVAPRITELWARFHATPEPDRPEGIDTRAAARLAWTLGIVTHALVEDYTLLAANPVEGWCDIRDGGGDTYRLTLRRTDG